MGASSLVARGCHPASARAALGPRSGRHRWRAGLQRGSGLVSGGACPEASTTLRRLGMDDGVANTLWHIVVLKRKLVDRANRLHLSTADGHRVEELPIGVCQHADGECAVQAARIG